MSMYRHRRRTRPKRTPQQTEFWRCANQLREYEFATCVHALAFYYPQAYYFLLTLLEQNTPLEWICILLYKHHSPSVQKLQKLGFGSVSPHTLATFKHKYFLTGQLPDPQQDKAMISEQFRTMIELIQLQRQKLNVLLEIEEQSGVLLKETTKLMDQTFKHALKALEYQLKLYPDRYFSPQLS